MTNMDTGQDQEVYEMLRQLAAANPDAQLSTAMTAYEDARIDGLCHEGAWEAALAALLIPPDPPTARYDDLPDRTL